MDARYSVCMNQTQHRKRDEGESPDVRYSPEWGRGLSDAHQRRGLLTAKGVHMGVETCREIC